MLLYGPPGTGKTLIARQIGKMLNGKEPKIVNGPEVLSKYVGQAEENIRNLFGEAEVEYKEKGDASVRTKQHQQSCSTAGSHARWRLPCEKTVVQHGAVEAFGSSVFLFVVHIPAFVSVADARMCCCR